LLEVRLGFGFSAGLFDYLLNYGLATRPLLLIPVGLIYACLYYATFSWCIRRFNLKTPGRDAASTPMPPSRQQAMAGTRAERMVDALGGADNLAEIDACTTRLRLKVRDDQLIDEAGLRATGMRGVLRLGAGSVQIVIGPEADQLASEMRAIVSRPGLGKSEAGDVIAAVSTILGPAGLTSIERRAGRLVVVCEQPERVTDGALHDAGIAGIARTNKGLQLILRR
jgi:PTS system N-acetylglucosamine-specific IIC component